jgi:hypothetical protein
VLAIAHVQVGPAPQQLPRQRRAPVDRRVVERGRALLVRAVDRESASISSSARDSGSGSAPACSSRETS